MKYNVIEKFVSIDGEGPSSGELATFIRFFGCDLRCSWCDTAYSWNGEVEAESLTTDELYNFIKESGAFNVTLTGGEPLIQKDIGDLIEFLSKDENLVIRIETHGGVNIATFKKRFVNYGSRVQFVIDYKLPMSDMMDRMYVSNLTAVSADDTYKFVIGSALDLEMAIDIVLQTELTKRCQVYFSPVIDLIDPRDIVSAMVDNKLNRVKLQLQLHKYIWPKDMRGI